MESSELERTLELVEEFRNILIDTTGADASMVLHAGIVCGMAIRNAELVDSLAAELAAREKESRNGE